VSRRKRTFVFRIIFVLSVELTHGNSWVPAYAYSGGGTIKHFMRPCDLFDGGILQRQKHNFQKIKTFHRKHLLFDQLFCLFIYLWLISESKKAKKVNFPRSSLCHCMSTTPLTLHRRGLKKSPLLIFSHFLFYRFIICIIKYHLKTRDLWEHLCQRHRTQLETSYLPSRLCFSVVGKNLYSCFFLKKKKKVLIKWIAMQESLGRRVYGSGWYSRSRD